MFNFNRKNIVSTSSPQGIYLLDANKVSFLEIKGKVVRFVVDGQIIGYEYESIEDCKLVFETIKNQM